MNLYQEIEKEITRLRKRIEALESARNILTSRDQRARASKAKPQKKRKLTPEGRRRISEAVKRRWAKQKKAA